MFHGTADGTLAAGIDYPAPFEAFEVTLGDLDRDGAADIVAASGAGLAFLRNRGDGTFATGSPLASSYQTPEIADLDSDGIPDVLALGISSLVLMAGNGDGTVRAPMLFNVGELTFDYVLADFDRDRRLDVAAIGGAGNRLGVLLARCR